MKSLRNRIGILIVMIFAAGAIVAGCSDNTVEGPDDEDEVLNPDKPNANDLVVSQTTLGDTEKGSYITYLIPDPSGGYYFAGRYDSDLGVGRLSTHAALYWFTETGLSVRDVCMLSPSAVVSSGVIAVGGIDTDGDDESEMGYVSLYGSNGNFIDQVIFSSGTSDVWLNSVAAVSDSAFLVAGGETGTGAITPFIGIVGLASSGLLEERYTCAIEAIPDRLFRNVVIDPSEPLTDKITFYALSDGMSSQSELRTITVYRLSAAYPELTSCTLEWSKEIIVTAGMGTYAYNGCGLRFFQGNLYLVGLADDPAKQPAPSNGGYWKIGMAASLTPAGDLRWLTSVALTGHDEAFAAMAIGSDALYAVGHAASFFRSDNRFGYGLVTEIALETGEVISNMTIGEDTYRSLLYGAVLSGNTITCGGYTGYELTGGGYVAWFCEIDVSNPPAAPLLSSESEAAAGDGATMVLDGDRKARTGPAF